MCVHFLRGNEIVKTKFQEIEIQRCFISEITIAELYFGAENSQNPKDAYAAANLFISALNVLPLEGVFKIYAEEKVRLRKAGTPLNDEFDLLIGVTATYHNLVMVTSNEKHFARLTNISIENWINP
jgi:tRNA(fMet)-specific endonuclease VapC